MSHTYTNRLTGVSTTIPMGWPHGDIWTHIMHPGAKPTHDVERWMILQEELKKKGKKP